MLDQERYPFHMVQPDLAAIGQAHPLGAVVLPEVGDHTVHLLFGTEEEPHALLQRGGFFQTVVEVAIDGAVVVHRW